MAYVCDMKVTLVASTKIEYSNMTNLLIDLDPELENWVHDREDLSSSEILSEFAGKSCYMSFSTSLNKNLTKVNTRDNLTYLQEGIIGNNHGSVLEHSSVSFYIENISRVVTHELIRHRVGTAFSQLSGRYVRLDEIPYYFPISLLDPETVTKEQRDRAQELFKEAFEHQEKIYKELCELYKIDEKNFETKKLLTSAFRRIVGDGMTANNILLTANHRSLRHMIELRTSRHAEEEIRLLFNYIFEICRNEFPNIYADAKVENVRAINEITFGHFNKEQ